MVLVHLMQNYKQLKLSNMIHKNPREVEIYNRYKKWLYTSEPIPRYIVDNYNAELEIYKQNTLENYGN